MGEKGGGREGEDAYFILPVVPSWRREKKKESRGRGGGGEGQGILWLHFLAN